MYGGFGSESSDPRRRLVLVGLAAFDGPCSPLEDDLLQTVRSVLLAVWADPGWWGGRFRADVAAVLCLPAGPQLMAALAGLERGGCPARHDDGPPDAPAPGSVPGFPCLCQLAVAAAWQACVGFAQANADAAIVDAAGAEAVRLPRAGARPPIADPAREELACALRLSPGSASTRIAAAREQAALPQLAALAAQGVLPQRFAARIGHALSGLSPDDAAQAAGTLADRVRARIARGRRPWTGSDAAAAAQRLAIRCPSYTEARRKAVDRRRVESWSNGDGTSTVQATLPEAGALRIMRRLTALADGLAGDPRPIDCRRADLFTDLLLGHAAPGATGVEVNVIVRAESLLGRSDTPAMIPGHGPIPADVARELAADARWTAWISDANGAVTATGTRCYRPTEALARLIRAREQHCRMPGCRQPSARCDLDHAIPWPKGLTTQENLGPLCRRHHIQKTFLPWQLAAPDPATQTWRTPAGTTITDEPDEPCPI